MSVLPIITGSENSILRSKTHKVPQVSKEILKLLKDMQETVKEADGVGLAAPQVGKSLRLCLALLNGKMTPLINPKISWKSKETAEAEEGCLSLPGANVVVSRALEIIVQFLDEKGREKELKLTDLEARIVQHEVDHLEGKLIVDYR